MYKVVVDIAPRTLIGTNGCHKYVFNSYKTKKKAIYNMNLINKSECIYGTATVEKSEY